MSDVSQNFYHMMLGLPADIGAPDHYELLGVNRFEDDVERIRTAAIDRNRQLLSWQNSEFHGNADHLMNEVVAARATLLDPERKAAYDRQLGRMDVAPRSASPKTGSPRPSESEISWLMESAARMASADAASHAEVVAIPKQRQVLPQSVAHLPARAAMDLRWRLAIGAALLGFLLIGSWMFVATERKLADAAFPVSPTAHPEIQSALPVTLTAPFTLFEAQAAQQAWAQFLRKPGPVERNTIGSELVLIPPGKFLMGSPNSDIESQSNEKPPVEVTLMEPLYVGKTEVTQGEWTAVMNTAPWKQDDVIDVNYPATHVSWDDAQEFCRRLSEKEDATYRLLTEAEWEYACRAGTPTAYHFGNGTAELADYDWFASNAFDVGERHAHATGQKLANPFGLCDMHGNVSEWCGDWYQDSLPGGTDPVGASSGDVKVFRSASWLNSARYCRSAYRGKIAPGIRSNYMGFRVARVPASK